MMNAPLHLFVTGMFRSGTTLFARMFNTHRRIVLASDPYAPLFKAFRNEIGFQIFGEAFDEEGPLGDYYFDSAQQALFREIQETSFNIPLTRISNEELVEKISRHAEPYSPKILTHLSRLDGQTFQELLQQGMSVVQEAYQTDAHSVLGIKEVWSGEFSKQFLNALPNSRVIHIVRDPRAVIASNLASDGPYPLLFLTRQWRKLATLACFDDAQNPRCLLVSYENLIRNPEKEGHRICDFLKIDFDPNILAPQAFKDGQNQTWTQNTSYQTGGQTFNLKSLEKWKGALSNDQIKTVEFLCGFEMKLMKYQTENNPAEMTAGFLFESLDEDASELAQWILPYTKYEMKKEVERELMRYHSLNEKTPVSSNEKRALCLQEYIYQQMAPA